MRQLLLVLGLVVCLSSVARTQTGWTVQNVGINSLIRSVKSVNRQVGWISADGGVIRRTTDGGATWQTIPSPTSAPYALAAIDSSTAMVTHYGSSGIIYRTTNSGLNWVSVFDQPDGFIDALVMLDRNIGFALGDPVNGKWTILKTTNGGATWQHFDNEPVQIGNEYGWTQSLCTIGTRFLWFGSNESKIYRTTDAGLSWSYSVAPSALCSAVSFADSLNGVAGFGNGTVAYSSDGGATWNPVTVPGSGSIWGIATDGARSFWLPRADTVFVSTDRGRTWRSEFVSPLGGYLRDIHFSRDASTVSGWVGSSTGGVARYVGTLTSVEHDENAGPISFVLNQNYPDPFNPSTTISYTIPRATNITLSIHNMLGQQVETIVNEYRQVGSYSVVWNADRFASGIYFYRLSAGNSVLTKKLVLIK